LIIAATLAVLIALQGRA